MIISISGNPEVGKTTVSDYFVAKGLQRVSFNDTPKVMAYALLINSGYNPATAEYFLYQNKKAVIEKLGVSGQTLVDRIKKVGGFWDHCTLSRLPENCVVDSVTTEAQIKALKDLGAITLNVTTGDAPTGFDYTVRNTGSLNELSTKLDIIWSCL